MTLRMFLPVALAIATSAVADTAPRCGAVAIPMAGIPHAVQAEEQPACLGNAHGPAATLKLAAIAPAPQGGASPVDPGEPIVVTAPAKFAVGMNLAPVGNDSTQLPFIDYLKMAGDPAKGTLTVPAALGPVDLVLLYDGSPAVSVYSPRATVANAIGVNNMGGNGDFSKPGRVLFPRAPGGSFNIQVSHVDPANPIRNMRLIRKSDEAAFRASEIVNPDFIAFIKAFSPLRTMDWNCTNGGAVTTWAERAKVTDAFWGCVPLEVQVAVANKARSDLWLNIPAHADDDYIREAVTLVRDTLDPSLKLHLEWSNEVWNTNFEQSKYAQAQADRLWGKGTPVAWGHERFAGYRSAQMSAIARGVFGADAGRRLAVIYSTFPHWAGNETDDAYHAGVAAAGQGTVAQLFDKRATTTYFGGEFGIPGGWPEDAQTILGWVLDPTPAGLDKAFQQLEHGNLLKGNDSLDWLASVYPIEAARAKADGLELVAYEGGLHISFFGTDHPNEFVAFVRRMKADPRMKAIYTRLLDDFARAGGRELTHFNDVGKTGIFGAWPVIDKLGDTSPELEALRAANGR